MLTRVGLLRSNATLSPWSRHRPCSARLVPRLRPHIRPCLIQMGRNGQNLNNLNILILTAKGRAVGSARRTTPVVSCGCQYAILKCDNVPTLPRVNVISLPIFALASPVPRPINSRCAGDALIAALVLPRTTPTPASPSRFSRAMGRPADQCFRCPSHGRRIVLPCGGMLRLSVVIHW